ncbi:WhiB family transcriptional regulator [Streptomyces fradiae]|uniref:WhiB family transcriptional regulator n=1 Tax=Streptomyces fradiae TaxID=1906 RepID=UPI0039878764
MHRQYIVRTVHAPSTGLPSTADWRAQGACRGEDPDLFFPIGTSGAALLQIEEAKAICRRRCPVAERCLRWALDRNEQHGVWGGTDETERRRMKRRAARKAALDAA